MPGKKLFAVTFGATALVTIANGATCPIEECDYQDSNYKAVFSKWLDCANDHRSRFERALASIAVLYPRFGIAYNAYTDEQKDAVRSDGTIDFAAVKEIKQRFEDRILRTAESEALADYNLLLLTEKQHPVEAQCGALPQPPKILKEKSK